jgi:predicted signal transduction protein with EAL and GGDEF domain
MSIGAAIFPHDGDTYEALLATADSRMYRDKTRRKRPRLQAAAGTDGHAVISDAGTGSTGEIDVPRAGIGLL